MTSKTIYHFIYETTNLINGKIYRGVHQTSNLKDGYLGSGVKFTRALKKYGKKNFTREILFFAFSREDADEIEEIFVSKEWLEENSKNIYNIAVGGSRKHNYLHLSDGTVKHRTKDKVQCIDLTTGDLLQVEKSVFDVQDKLVGVTNGFATYMNLFTGRYECIRTDDPMLLAGNYRHIHKDKVNIIRNCVSMKIDKKDLQLQDKYQTQNLPQRGEVTCYDIRTGERIHVSKEEFDSNENLVGITKGKSVHRNKSGETLQLSQDDERVLSGEFIPVMTGIGQFKDKSGKVYNLQKDDPLIKELGLMGMTYGHVTVFDLTGKTVYISVEEFKRNPDLYRRVLSGRKRVYSNSGEEKLLYPTDERVLSGEYKTRYEWISLGNENMPKRKL